MKNNSVLKKILLDTFTTRAFDSVWRYTHLFRWAWFVVLPLLLLMAHSYGILNFSMILFALLTAALKLFFNFWGSQSEDKIKTEKIALRIESIAFGFWPGVLGLNWLTMILMINFMLVSILFFGTRAFYLNIIFFALGLFLGFAYQGFTVIQTVTIWDYFMYGLLMVQVFSITILIRYVNKRTSILENLMSSDNNLLKHFNVLSDVWLGSFDKNTLVSGFQKGLFELLKVSEVIYFGVKNESELFFNTNFSTVSSPTDEAALARVVLSSKNEKNFLSDAFRQGALYFYVKDDRKQQALGVIYDQFKARILVLLPVFINRKLEGVFILASHDENFMNNKFKCFFTQLFFLKILFLGKTAELLEERHELKTKNEFTQDGTSYIAASLKKYFPENLVKNIIESQNKKVDEVSRKRILILTIDLGFLLSSKFSNFIILNDFYHFIFNEFNKICKNHNGTVEALLADRLVTYWIEDDITLKGTANESLLVAMELRETANAYFKRKLSKSESFTAKMKAALHVSYVTFDSFGNKKYSEYTYFSPQAESIAKYFNLIPGYSIICDETVQLLLSRDVTSLSLPVEENSKNKLFLLLATEFEKVNQNKILHRVEESIKRVTKIAWWEKLRNWLNPTQKNTWDWIKELLIDLFSSKGIDSSIRYLQYFRWILIPLLIGSGGILYMEGLLSVPIIIFMIGFVLYKLAENFCAKRLKNPIKNERIYFIVVDSFLSGILVGLCSLPLLFVLFSVYLLISYILYFGMKAFLRYFLSYLLGVLSGLLYIRFAFDFTYNIFFEYYFYGLLLVTVFLVSFTKIIYSRLLNTIETRERTQKDNLKNLWDLTQDKTSIISMDELSNHTAGIMKDTIGIAGIMYYEIKEDNQLWLKKISGLSCSHEEIRVLKSLPLTITGDNNIFLGTFHHGNLYFQLFDGGEGKSSSALLKMMNLLNMAQLVLCPHFKDNMLKGLVIFPAMISDIMTDSLKLIPLTLWAADFIILLDSIEYTDSLEEKKTRIEKLEIEKNNIKERLKNILPAVVNDNLFSDGTMLKNMLSRNRLVTLHVDLTPLLSLKTESENSLLIIYEDIFNSFDEIVKRYEGEIETLAADRLVAYWRDEDTDNFKELTNRTFLAIEEFRERYKTLLGTKTLANLPMRAAINTNYGTLGMLGTQTLQQYTLVNPLSELLIQALIKEKNNTVLCDEATNLLIKNSKKTIQLSDGDANKKIFQVFLTDEDSKLFEERVGKNEENKNFLADMKYSLSKKLKAKHDKE